MLSSLLTGINIFLICFKPIIHRLDPVLSIFTQWETNQLRFPTDVIQVMLVNKVFYEFDRLYSPFVGIRHDNFFTDIPWHTARILTFLIYDHEYRIARLNNVLHQHPIIYFHLPHLFSFTTSTFTFRLALSASCSNRHMSCLGVEGDDRVGLRHWESIRTAPWGDL